MKNILKKICICGASLMMVSSLGADINNVSARRVHHHTRTHRVAMSSHALFKQGRNDSNLYSAEYTSGLKDLPSTSTIYKRIINKLIRTHFNKSYINGLGLINSNQQPHAGISAQLSTDIISTAKRVARRHSHNTKPVKHIRKSNHRRYHARKSQRNKRNNREHRKAKRAYNVKSHHYADFNPFTASTKTIERFNKTKKVVMSDNGRYWVSKKFKKDSNFSPMFRKGFFKGQRDLNNTSIYYWNDDTIFPLIPLYWKLRYNHGYATAWMQNNSINNNNASNPLQNAKYINAGRKQYENILAHPRQYTNKMKSAFSHNFVVHIIR